MIGGIVLKSLFLEDLLRKLMLDDYQLGLILNILFPECVVNIQGLARVYNKEAVLFHLELRGQLRGHDFLDGEICGEGQFECGDVPADGFEVDVECVFGQVSAIEDVDNASIGESDGHAVVIDPETVVKENDALLWDVEPSGGNDGEVGGLGGTLQRHHPCLFLSVAHVDIHRLRFLCLVELALVVQVAFHL